ncbi:D-alanyl-D-alanine carboxypeptidase family protein [Parahaliea mediterranea]|uniref:serine-type D-Ala-D-Ala carboxypeptidase n=1 Tax=Parahaliea mediterranea TaxID=651086 RepID=A0A939ING6_9GAMM|nr:D-alanyl-D-alanine carboxypeptidase family protein [Parahaliea mediterranea]MBN7798540.1 D-alanyl-D-alanine carboxypeptidase [Parahaliea mediterranea]
MKRFTLFIFLLCSTLGAGAATVVPSPPQVAAESYILMDADSGAVLVEHNADVPLPPASLTKMMTAYVLAGEIEAGRVKRDDKVVVSENAWSQNPVFAGSSLMWIEPGKDVTIEDLERGIIVSSGNDATVAVAEHIAGSEAAFAELMNSNAEALGMRNSYFVNSHGLQDADHVTTARDLAILARAMIEDYPTHYALYKERDFTYNGIKQYNRNTLMAEDPSVDGLKTGHTDAAGYCLVASAKRRDMRLISVVMGTASPNSRKNESRSLLNYGFRFYETVNLFDAGQELEKPRIWKGAEDYVAVGLLDGAVATLPRGKRDQLSTELELRQPLEAPLSRGDEVGTVRLTLDGEPVFQSPVVALQSVESGGFFARLWDMVLMWISSLFSAG